MALFAQQEIPAGYESIYSVVGEEALTPDTADAQTALRILGPITNWNADLYDFTDYQYIDVKIRYQMADTGKQVAFRYYAAGAVKIDIIDLPNVADTSYTKRFNLPDYAVDGSVWFGGMWLYNGETSSGKITWTGDVATGATIVDYVAIKKKPEIPEGWVSIFSIKEDFEKAPYPVGAQAIYQLTGPGADWHLSKDYNITNYDTLALKIRYHAADIGKEVAIRFAVNGDGTVQMQMITLPDVADTTLIIKIGIADYADGEGNVALGGFLFYNGASHWSLTYNDPATMPTLIEYMALKIVYAESLAIVPEDEGLAQALPFDVSTTLNAVFTPVNTTNQAVTWSSGDETKAVVDENGEVTAQQVPGDVIITAVSVENETISAQYTVTVIGEAVDVTGVSLTEENISIKIGFEGGPAEYTIQPENASVKSVNWAVSDTTIAKVDEDGIISSISAGTTKLYVITKDGGFKDSCTVTIVGYKDIPIGYASLYSLEYNMEGTVIDMNTLTTFPAAPVPGMFNTDKDNQTGSLLGDQWNWNRFDKYCDVSDYSELVVSTTFKKEDVGKTVRFRYTFSTSSADVSGGSVITNRDVLIDQEEMLFVIDLLNDTADVEDLQHLGAIKFQDLPERLNLVVDYVALKKLNLSSDATLSDIKLEGISLFGFEPEIQTYNINLNQGVTSITVTATPTDNSSTVVITDGGIIDVSSGSATVTITVTAEDGTTIVYTLNFTVQSSGVDVLEDFYMKIYPTITSGLINIEFSQTPGSVTVYDLTGKIVMKETIQSSTHVISLNRGLYIVRLESKGVSKTVKIVCTQ